MVASEKRKIGFITLVLIILTFVVIDYRYKSMFVEVIYFRKSSCIIISDTDKLMEEIENKFGNELKIRTIDLDNEENLTEDDKALEERYQVVGVPEIIINGKEYTREFTKEKLEKEICKRFLIKPEACK